MTNPSRDTAAGLVREGERAFAGMRHLIEEHGPLPCCVRHADAGGQCERSATMEVYGQALCEIHGAESKAGALIELYHDARNFLEHFDNPHVPMPNDEAARALEEAMYRFDDLRRPHEEAEEEALRRAYPEIPERVCAATTNHDYDVPGDTPQDVYMNARRLLCQLMRLAYGEGADWLVETLEYERQQASAQAAFALADYERKVGQPTA